VKKVLKESLKEPMNSMSGQEVRVMKVQDFRNSVQNFGDITKKIQIFKSKLAFEQSKAAMNSCAVCANDLSFHYERTLAGLKMKEITHCLHCNGVAVQRFYSLN